jgi:hypothetical protein
MISEIFKLKYISNTNYIVKVLSNENLLIVFNFEMKLNLKLIVKFKTRKSVDCSSLLQQNLVILNSAKPFFWIS